MEKLLECPITLVLNQVTGKTLEVIRKLSQKRIFLRNLQSLKDVKQTHRGVFPSEKTEKIDPSQKLIFLDLSSPLDWLLMIWAIFRLLGPSGGPGGPSGGLGGSGEPEIVRFHMGPIFALRCHVLGQNNLTHYVFDIFGQIWALRAQKTPFWAKIGYTEKCSFPKTVSPNLAHIAPKRLLGTIF